MRWTRADTILFRAPPSGEPADWRTLRRPMLDLSRRVWRREGGFRFSGPSSTPNGTPSGIARMRDAKKRRDH
ncbi:hypothetical protein [Emcibacter sp. SYSU 3D8]|uniref:hypothetical protein n=1 Tax=Emcibacter sp. SYSU 3D8 TaxID=3133969 RepID=UPI0031FE50BF